MKKMLIIALALLFLSACSTQQSVHNVSDSKVPLRVNGSMLTTEEVRKIIFSAANNKGWTPSNVGKDTIEAKIIIRQRHEATIDINYSDRNYSFTLKSSAGLDEKAGMIHRNYNKWIILLDQQIQAELLEEATK